MNSFIYRRSYGRNCEAGWGYDAENGVFIENSELTRESYWFSIPITAYTKEFNINVCNFFGFVSYPDTSFIESVVGKNKNVYKFLDFIIQNSKTNGFISEITALTKISKISDPPVSYPMKATHYIKEVSHGLQMFVIFDKNNSRLFKQGIVNEELLNKIWRRKENLTVEQRNVMCSVLIFSSNPEKTIIKEMTINDIRELLLDPKNEKYSDFIGSVKCHLKPVPNYKVFVISQDEINTIETQLFYLYQKQKLLDEELDLLLSSSKKSSNEFSKVKKYFKLLKSEYEKLWNLRIGQCSSLLKGSKLTDFELISNSTIDEPVARELQTLIVEKIEPEFCSMMNDQIVMMDKDYFCSLDPEMAKKLKMGVFLSNEDGEPFVSIKNLDKKIFIGFASHQEIFTNYEIETTEMFVSRCPKNCTRDERQWICVTCGNFFKAKNFEVVCDCGTTHVTNLKLECFDPKHPKTVLPSSLKSCSTSGNSTPRTTSSPILEKYV